MKLFIKIIMGMFCIVEILTRNVGDIKVADFQERVIESDILLHLRNGLEDPAVTAYYHQDIEDVKKLSDGDIQIEYCDVDLNGDGAKDKIVIMRSPLHSGSMGDAFQILLNDGTDNYGNIFYGIYRFYTQDSGEILGEVNILSGKTNGFYNIEIVSGGDQTVIKYADGRYY